uniref:interferon alpha/beta receptor 2-like n=1 Tax=Pristiophorus japonicus TaxID=55135 RepID=UPI00398E4842
MMFKVVGLLYFHQFLNSASAVMPPPRNASFMSENFRHILMWEAGIDAPFGTNYTVEYLPLNALIELSANPCGPENQWLVAQNCSLITNRSCDLTDDFSDINESYWARVKAVTEMDESNWTCLDEFQPHQDTKIRPINIHLAETPVGVLKINFDTAAPPPHISRSLEVKSLMDIYGSLYYQIDIFKSGELEKNRNVFRHTDDMSVEEIVENVQPHANYCVTIKMFKFEEDRSDPLEMKCIVTQYVKDDKVPVPQTLLIVALCILGFGLVICITLLYRGGCLGIINKYGPQALNNLKRARAVYSCNDVQDKISTVENVCFKEKKIQYIEEDSEEELMNSDEEAGYEHNSLPVPVQNSSHSSSAFSKGTDGASTMSCDDQLCDSGPEHFSTDLNDCQMAPTDLKQNECPDTETMSQMQEIHSRKGSSASDVPLCSVQIQDTDSCFIDFANETMHDLEALKLDTAEIDDLRECLRYQVCENAGNYQSENRSLCDVPGHSSLPQALHSNYMRR